ncbi:hypothetical protein NE865_14332 [Phthorimaea operculella]|nr:hypothetical protein NE865_14332 [Phthorimaea operculella]
MAPDIVCQSCKQHVNIIERLQCVVYRQPYHCECAGILKDDFNAERHNIERSWTCTKCRKLRNDDTPIRKALDFAPDNNVNKKRGGSRESYQSPGVDNESLLYDDTHNPSVVGENTAKTSTKGGALQANQNVHNKETVVVVTSDLAVEMQLLRQELSASRDEMMASRAEMQELRNVISSLTNAVKICNSRIDDLTVRVDNLEKTRDEPLPSTAFELTIAELKSELNDRDQELLCNDIDIAGVPEENAELPIHLTLNIAAKLGVSLEERDIVSAERSGGVRRASPDQSVRPRPLVVRLARRVRRDEILREARVRRNTTTAGLGLASPEQRIFINERLSRFNRNIFYKARSESQRVNWKYVWTKDGKIYTRRAHGEPCHRLRTEDDIKKFFGSSQC